MQLQIKHLPIFTDNYVYLVVAPHLGKALVIDPGEAKAVSDYLATHSLELEAILLTHHHYDHIDGVEELRQRFGPKVYGAKKDAHRLPALDRSLEDGDRVDVGWIRFQVLSVPGHTLGHIAYYAPEASLLFSGDTLFSIGCGRLFEGTPESMWASLCRLRSLPEDTKVYPTHEYTLKNLDFALSLTPHNKELQKKREEVLLIRQSDSPSLPTTLGQERKFNPFLRADDPLLQKDLGFTGADPVELFAAMRQKRDVF